MKKYELPDGFISAASANAAALAARGSLAETVARAIAHAVAAGRVECMVDLDLAKLYTTTALVQLQLALQYTGGYDVQHRYEDETGRNALYISWRAPTEEGAD